MIWLFCFRAASLAYNEMMISCGVSSDKEKKWDEIFSLLLDWFVMSDAGFTVPPVNWDYSSLDWALLIVFFFDVMMV